MSITQYKTPQHSSTCWVYKSYMDNNDIIRVCLQYYTCRDQLHLVSMLQRWYKIFLVLHVQLNCQHKRHLKTASQYDIGTSVASQASGWRQNRLDFYSNIASSALASIQPIRLLKFWHQEYILTSKKKYFYMMLTALQCHYCEPGFNTINHSYLCLWCPVLWILVILPICCLKVPATNKYTSTTKTYNVNCNKNTE